MAELNTELERPITRKKFADLSSIKVYIPVISAIILLLVLGQSLSSGFASIMNIGNLLALASILAFACVGQTLIVIAGKEGIDLSVGSLMSMGALFGAVMSGGETSGVPIALVGLCVIGALIGFINAVGITWLNMPPLVMTMGMATVIDGLVVATTKGQPSGRIPDMLVTIGNGVVFGPVRWLVVVGMILIIAMEIMLRKSSYGRKHYLIGSNRNAAFNVGLKVKQHMLVTYIIAGVAAALAGLVLASNVGSAAMGMGNPYTLLTVAAVVIGGTQLSGGKGTFLGSALGSLLIIVLSSVLLSVGMQAGIRNMMQGIILLLILMVYSRDPKLRQ